MPDKPIVKKRNALFEAFRPDNPSGNPQRAKFSGPAGTSARSLSEIRALVAAVRVG